MDKYVGKRLDGRYEIREVIGVGGMAVVYKAYDCVDNRIVAIKILKEEYLTNDEFLRRFKNESKAIAVLSHPNIVKVLDVSLGDLIQYIVMEYIEGVTLKEYIESQGSLVWRDAIYFTIQILRALQHAHDKGIVHRDVKPQNIMLLEDGTIKVTDFGIARFARSEHKTITDKAIGSVHYISPEQARGEVTDEKADVYSVGVILYEMLTGRLPFQADSAVSVAIMQLQNEPELPRKINSSIPLGLEQITMQAMQKDTKRRYQSASEILKDLEEFRRDPEMEFGYNCYVDDSPTKFVEILAESQDDNNQEINLEKENQQNEKSKVLPVLAGVAVAFVVSLIIICVVFMPRLFSSSGKTVECPNFIGQNYNDIISKDEYKDYKFDVSYENSVQHEMGIIFEQRPEEGKTIKLSQSIKITVSMGAKTVTVPDVYGFDVAIASSTLTNEGFVVKKIEKEDDEIAKDRIISTVPGRNENVAEGSIIEMYVSTGAAVAYVSTPNVIGLDQAEAKKKIEERGLTVGKITEINSTSPKGVVISQNPTTSDSAETAKGTAINLEVSNGIAPIVEYSYPIEIDLPNDIVENFFVEAYLDGTSVFSSSKLLSSGLSSNKYSFSIKTTKKEGNVKVVLKDTFGNNYDFADYFVNFEKKTLSKLNSSKNLYPVKS